MYIYFSEDKITILRLFFYWKISKIWSAYLIYLSLCGMSDSAKKINFWNANLQFERQIQVASNQFRQLMLPSQASHGCIWHLQ